MSDTARAEDRALLRSSSIMAVGTIVSRITGLFRNFVIAAALGTAILGDAYNVGNTLPNILYILLVGGVLNSVFVPQLVRAMKDDPDGGQAYANRLITVTTLVLVVFTVVAVVAAPWLVRLYASDSWTTDDLDTATAFARYCLPQILFYGLHVMLGQVLNARGRFGPMMFTPILNNLVVIGTGLLFIAVTSDGLSTSTITTDETRLLGLGTTTGVVVQALAMIPSLRATGFRIRPRLDLRGNGLGKAGNLAKWTLLFVAVNQVSYLVVVNAATGAAAEAQGVVDHGVGYTPYSTAYLLFLLPHAIVTVSLVTALLPRMSRHVTEGRIDDVRDDLSTGLRLTAAVIIPSALALLVLGPDIATVLYERGRVGSDDARYIGYVLSAFALGLVPFSGHHLTLRGFYAFEDTRTPFFIQVGVVATNITLVLTVAALLPVEWRTVGMAAGYATSYAVGFGVALTVLRRRIGGVDGARLLRAFTRMTVAAVSGAMVALAVSLAANATMGQGVVASLVAITVGLAAGGAVYLLVASWLHISEVTAALGMVRRRLGR